MRSFKKVLFLLNIFLNQTCILVTFNDVLTLKKFLWLYVQFVRCHLEFAVPAWSPWSVADIVLLEKFQQREVNLTNICGKIISTGDYKLCKQDGWRLISF